MQISKATGIAKNHSINSIVIIVGKFKIMRSGPPPKTVTVVYLFG